MSTTKKSVLILLILVFLGIAGYVLYTSLSPKDEEGTVQITYSVYENENGWGYDILVGEKTFIHQPVIPALDGNDPFPTRASAEAAARSVAAKLENGDSPSLTLEEVEAILEAE